MCPICKGMYKYKYIVDPTLRIMQWRHNTERKKVEGKEEGEGEMERGRGTKANLKLRVKAKEGKEGS